MTNKGPKTNFTKFPNEMLEALAKADISREVRVLIAIMRETVGWSRNEKVLSAYKISEMTGIDPRNVYLALASLEKKKFITRDRKQTGNTIALMPPEMWQIPVSEMTSCQIRHHVKNDTTTSVRSDTTTSVKNDTTGMPMTPDLIGVAEDLKTVKDSKDSIPQKMRAQKQVKAARVNPWAVWVDVHRRIARVDPVAIGPDTSAAKKAFAALGSDPEKLEMCFENFLYDDDSYLASSGWALRDILKRLNKYMSQGKAYFDMNGERCSYQKWLEEEERIRKFALEAEQDKIKNERLDREWRQRMEEAAKDKKEAPIVKRLLAHINATV